MSKPRLKVTPLRDLVLIEERAVGKVAGLHIPESAKSGVSHHVIEAGPDVTSCKAGDRVLLRSSACLGVADYMRVLFHQDDILAIVEDLPDAEQPSNLVLL